MRLDELDPRTPRPGEVAVSVEWCGLCGTDLHEVRSGPSAVPTADKPHPLTGATLPIVLGHEFSGVVRAVGDEVTRVKPGERVVIEPLLSDGRCAECRAGHPNRCRRIAFIGLSATGGGLGEIAVVPATATHRLPTSVATEAAALVEPCAVAWHAIDQTGIVESDDVLVLGAGPVGLAVVLCLRHRGAGRIVVSEPSDRRRRAAAELGADLVLDPASSDIGREARGVQAALDCAGHPDGITSGLQALTPGGRLVLVALPPRQIPLDPARLVHLEISVTGSIAYHDTFPDVLTALANGMDPLPLVSRRAPLEEIPTLLRSAALGQIDELKILARVGS